MMRRERLAGGIEASASQYRKLGRLTEPPVTSG